MIGQSVEGRTRLVQRSERTEAGGPLRFGDAKPMLPWGAKGRPSEALQPAPLRGWLSTGISGKDAPMAVELHQASIVFLGSFNPVIFQPKWLQEIDLLPASEFQNIEKSGNVVVSSDWTVVQLMAVRLEVLRERWALVTERPDWVGDLGGIARAIFKRLPETPITRVGFNDVRHRRINGDADARMGKWVPLDDLGKVA